MTDPDQKRIFLIASANEKLIHFLDSSIKGNVQNVTIFTAADGIEALFKAENVFPHVLIIDPGIAKMNAFDLAGSLLRRKERLSVIFLSPVPETDHFVDEVVTGQVQYLTSLEDQHLVKNCFLKALDWVFAGTSTSYRLRFLNTGDILLREGAKGDYVYLVKTGSLRAYKNDGEKEIELGLIQPGEFVGEMAYINGEARSATVSCLTPCELIEMPIGNLDVVLFSKPAWSKALMKTLSKRLKKSNEERGPSED
ncbi:cyclic nucleotide-binding domain-containing protein [Bdellovibrio svalbardensis]|uniref:Cyclic nucleotide-binding domain-containing protein n=1 Tax=Bdellovibrio svalbardensis TaxID=2972972 RepID=A0ABT6DMK4_9BACT|nr:cyclic nucleotide-binding domain-containing protein [Bdellovibrio svalbardensis]MDG0818097.1 cyclic nucleotide-binding domain-containing protein [Bdellovibrio svalbardensis]